MGPGLAGLGSAVNSLHRFFRCVGSLRASRAGRLHYGERVHDSKGERPLVFYSMPDS